MSSQLVNGQLVNGQLVNGKLTIEYGNALDDSVRTLSRLAYDRSFPEQGFVITDKEKKSQQDK